LRATEALELSKKTMLDNCISKAVTGRQNIQYIRQELNLLNLEVVTEDRKKKLMDKLFLLLDSFSVGM